MRGEDTPIEMQTSALKGKRETPDNTSSGSLKHFCFLAAVYYHPTMLSNQSRGSEILFRRGFVLFLETVEKGAF